MVGSAASAIYYQDSESNSIIRSTVSTNLKTFAWKFFFRELIHKVQDKLVPQLESKKIVHHTVINYTLQKKNCCKYQFASMKCHPTLLCKRVPYLLPWKVANTTTFTECSNTHEYRSLRFRSLNWSSSTNNQSHNTRSRLSLWDLLIIKQPKKTTELLKTPHQRIKLSYNRKRKKKKKTY